MANESAGIRLLQVAPKFSAEPTSGAELRIFQLATQLTRYMSVTHLGFAPPGTAGTPLRAHQVEFEPVVRQGAHRFVDLVRGAVGRTPFAVLNYTRDSMKAALRQRLNAEHFDIALLESVHLAAYVPLLRNIPRRPPAIVCDWHNIESEVLSRYKNGDVRPLRRLYGHLNASRLAAYERRFVNQCDLHIVVSERDRDTLLRHGVRVPVEVIDNGVDVAHFSSAQPDPNSHRVLYVGSMDAYENIDAVMFFATKVWPRLRGSLPQAVFTIVGRNPSREVRSLAGQERIEVTGSVSEVLPYYRQAFAAVAPLRVGGGTRLKILEAMAARVAVVSTRLGAEGLFVTPGVHYLLADNEMEMCDALVRIARDEPKRRRLVTAAEAVVRQRYDWPVLGDRLAAKLLSLIAS